MDLILKALKQIRRQGLYPDVPELSSPHLPHVIADGKDVLMFATNDYLGLMSDPRVIKAAAEGAKKWGIGNGSARLLTGNLEIHDQLERKIAKFKNRESALTFVSGFMANSGAIPALANVISPSLTSLITGKIKKSKDTVIFSDEYNHASIISGIKLSGAPKEIYKHVDIDDLESRLKKYSKKHRKMIVTDGVFSMDGSIAPLPEIIDLSKKYNALVYLDDAHATGILGSHGRGVEDYCNVEGESDVVMGTFTKSFGGVGGFIAGTKDLIDYLKISSDTFIFTAPIAPPVVYGLIEAIDIASTETWRREKVVGLSDYLRNQLLEHGFDTGGSKTQIVPLMIGDENKAMGVSRGLLKQGIFIPAARWPAVPKKKARLRMTVSCRHTKEQIDYLVSVIKKINDKLKF